MADPQSVQATAQHTEQVREESLLDQIVEEGRFGAGPESRERGKDLIKEFVSQFLAGNMTIAFTAEKMVDARIGEIDRLVSIQLNEVMHHPGFQTLESAWRGLKYLLDRTETGALLQIRVLNATKKELMKDLQRAPDFDQSALFKKVYEEEYGTFGGAPYGALVGYYEFGRQPEDIELLDGISHVAAVAHAPFCAAASPDLLNLPDWTKLDAPRDLSKVVDSTEYAKWKGFRQSEDSRYVALCLPPVLGRLPYGKETVAVEGFAYEEGVDGSDPSKYLWINSAVALAGRMTTSFAHYGMCVALRGVEGGGLVQGLPVHNVHLDDGDVVMKCPTGASITDRREKELANLGFVPLVHCKDTDYAAFFSVQSVQKPKVYDSDAANANAHLSAQLPYIMACSRFAHYLKAIMRDKVGSAMSRADVEVFLNRWINRYVTPDDTATQQLKARCPLREARVDVSEVSGKPGVYRAVAFLRPHFVLEELSVSLRLVVELPAPAAK